MGTEKNMDLGFDIAENARVVRERIFAAAARSGRDPDGIKLIAVSKTKPAWLAAEAYAAGLTAFGENHVQELCEKQSSDECRGLAGIEWHMIGHLQKNKVRQVVGKAALIHSVDSLPLALELQKNAQRLGLTVEILIQVNVANEESKFGFTAENTPGAAEEIAALPNLRIRGLMTVAPLTRTPEENRRHFRNLYELSLDIGRKRIHNVDMCILSMGMSNDFEVAVEEGANMLRIGTLLFGSRA
ncbi:MAG: YggS family pyridoxal phosphate-dependent enzyme [Clostridiales bacterium]|jgi:pyridoxal phosphate enzyme (YggS family)|nr:YggS family pyridoxal phosphate-dependent enzyme [Clostridiales bacterium]